MRFCTKCGTQLLDEAVICTKCGCMVAGAPVTKPKVSRTPVSKQTNATDAGLPSKVLTVFNFVFWLVAIVTLFFIILSIGYGRVETNIYTYNYGLDNYAYSYFCASEEACLAALISAILTFGLSVPAFIGTLTEKLKGDCFFAGIIKLFISCILLLTAIVLLTS